MKKKRSRGATLAFVVAAAFVIMVVGITVFSMTQLMGGARELSMLTDSGTLNMGKQLGVVGIPLQMTPQSILYQYTESWINGPIWGTQRSAQINLANGVEGSNFQALADANGNVSLQNYNRVIAQTMLVAFNAQAEGTQSAAANAQTLFDCVQRSPTSLSQRLLSTLSDPNVSSPFFLQTGMSNSLRMLGPTSTPTFVSSDYGVAYTSPGADTNVWIDATILPAGITLPASAVTSDTGPTSFPYLAGYTDIDTGPVTLQGTPVFPGRQPHLISMRDFDAGRVSPVGLGYVAPNSFGASCSANDHLTSKPVVNSSRSVVGLLNSGYPASIPGGYIVLTTVAGVGGTLAQVIQSLPASQQQSFVSHMVQRVRQIKPDLTPAAAQTFLMAQNIDPNPSKPTYIYLYPDPTSPLYPTWHAQVAAAGVPEGTPNQLYGSTVKPPTFPKGAPDPQVGVYPDGVTVDYQGWWDYEWTPSSGFGNLLGAMSIP